MRLLDDHVRRFNEGVRSEILGVAERDGIDVARYPWLRDHGKQAGEMRLTPQHGRIKRLVVTFG